MTASPMALAIATAWPVQTPARPARWAVLAEPMATLDPASFMAADEGATFEALLASHPAGTAGPRGWLCAVVADDLAAEAHLPHALWGTCPRPGDTVVFYRRALGGKSTQRLLLTLVVIAGSISTAGAFGAAYGSFYGAVAGTVASVVGNALVNALVPLDAANFAGATGGAQGTLYNVALQGNRARLGQPLPVLYGHTHEYPDFACEAYQVFVDNEQYYHAVLCCTVGYLDVLRVSIGGVPVDHLADVQALIIGPGQADGEALDDQTLVKTNIVNCGAVSSHEMKELKVVGPFVAVPRGRQAVKMRVDIGFPRGLDVGLSVGWVVQVRPINGFEQPAGPWQTLATETYSTARNTAWRESFEYTVAADRYQFRLYRNDIRSTSAFAAHDVYLIGLSVELDEPGIDVSIPATYVVLKLRGSQQLSVQSQLKVRVLSTRMLPLRTGTAWTAPTATRAIAPVVADILRNTDYGRALPDAQVDLATLFGQLDPVWAARFDKFDGKFDEKTDTDGALRQVLRVGRAVPIIRGSRYSFVRDGADTEPVALFGMRNIRKNSFTLALRVPEREQVTALDVQYLDQTVWDYVTLTVQHVGAGEFISYVGDTVPSPYTRAENRAQIRLQGAIGPAHVARVASYILADLLFRGSMATYRTHLDGLLPAYLSPVMVAHDVPDWGASGDVVDWAVGTLTVTTSEPLDFSAGGTHYMRLQNPAGGVVTWTVTEGAAPNEAIVSDALGFTPSFNSANRERTRYVFGPSTSAGALCRVKALTPRGKREIEHTVMLEDSRVHTADDPWLPVGGVDPDPPISDGSSTPPEDSDILVVRLLDRAVTGSTLSGVGDTTADIVATHTLQDNGLADYSFIGSTLSSGASLPNEWLQGGMVSNATAALYEVRDTIISSAEPAYGTATLTGTIGAWQSLGSPRTLALRWVGPVELSFAQREILREIRDVATSTVQDVAVITLRCEYPET